MTDTKVKVFYCSLMLQIKIKYPLIVQLEKYDPLSSNFGLDINVDIHLNFDLFFSYITEYNLFRKSPLLLFTCV